MKPNIEDMTLLARIEQFAGILQRCEITGKDNVSLGLESGIVEMVRALEQARETHAAVYVIGNGGSAAIASHVANDLINVARLRAMTIHESSALTCMANDYGYENAYANILERLARPCDVLIAISSSGNSQNIRKAAAHVTASGGTVITLTGFSPINPLRSMGAINVWLDSSDYGIVEVGHQFVLHNVSDRFDRAAKAAGVR